MDVSVGLYRAWHDNCAIYAAPNKTPILPLRLMKSSLMTRALSPYIESQASISLHADICCKVLQPRDADDNISFSRVRLPEEKRRLNSSRKAPSVTTYDSGFKRF